MRSTPDSGVGGVGLIGRRGHFEEVCPDPVQAEGARFEPRDEARQDLVMVITPRAEGSVDVSGIEVTYTRGWQRGTQVTGPSYAGTTDDP